MELRVLSNREKISDNIIVIGYNNGRI